MKPVNRRQFLGGALLTGSALTSSLILPEALAEVSPESQAASPKSTAESAAGGSQAAIDFRYAPVLRQTAFCFPDDPYKSLLNEKGDLLYGYDRETGVYYFPLQISFGLSGMKQFHAIRQVLEAPSVPIVHTELEDGTATMTLTTFATDNPNEGRVDNVLMEIRPRTAQEINVSPVVQFLTLQKFAVKAQNGILSVTDEKTQKILMLGKVFDNPSRGSIKDIFNVDNQQLVLHRSVASLKTPYRAFFRFPQAGQTAQIEQGVNQPDQQLHAARTFWNSWPPFHPPVSWQIHGPKADFVSACARNILQAREVKEGKLTFQVGPTCYRGLWIVDGNFILEAARYLGYDKEAIEGLRTNWKQQQPSGQIIAAGGPEHYKDTAIAMFTLVRQCELGQNWTPLRELEPNVVAAIQFLDSLRARAREEGSALGRYGLLPKGFGDGGLGGSRDEFTNTLWTMAGLKAIGAAGEQLNLPHVARATGLYQELLTAFNAAAPQEMRSYDGKFQYLPMLLKNDPAWQLPDPWDRPRPQAAQWALSHSIFPGRVFSPQHAVVKGHADLMLAVRQEEIPAETGWQPHEAVWTYNAPFVAEVLLWLGMAEQANSVFRGFLNHASPQYCWREEQPLQSALVGAYTGDMPHNWASAECIRYVRHSLALEDGPNLRLLAGITQGELDPGNPFILQGTPTRFGRLDLTLEPIDRKRGWRLTYRRLEGPVPGSVSVPSLFGNRFRLSKAEGVHTKRDGEMVAIDPAVDRWSITWNA